MGKMGGEGQEVSLQERELDIESEGQVAGSPPGEGDILSPSGSVSLISDWGCLTGTVVQGASECLCFKERMALWVLIGYGVLMWLLGFVMGDINCKLFQLVE